MTEFDLPPLPVEGPWTKVWVDEDGQIHVDNVPLSDVYEDYAP